ncbi:sigma-70 family RNA polymerase sigma factor [Gryllotalpicola ginsengisoli]|uniref:sigma-70 family RNA polymerase sigma factor n=1 Tax=Gryllotalpicola ginsengisoli TaxID=444608 RepID=UPI0003B52CE8|nr:sigma-70 family RNA polymerase sigma factor [Gryllotalpicola ginsengisoli]
MDLITSERRERSERTTQAFDRMRAAAASEQQRIGNTVVVEHLELADAIARRYRRGNEDYSDLKQVAMLGLVKAVRHFDPSRGTPFVPYAVPTINGELKRHLRDHGWFVRPGRQLQELCAQVTSARGRLAQSLGREPSDEEVAEELDTTAEAVGQARTCLDAQRPVAVDAPTDDDDAPVAVLAAEDDDSFDRAELRVTLAAALQRLSEREAHIVRRRFVDDRTQAEIGRELGITQMQVSRILSQVLQKLRAELEPYAQAS